MRLRLGFRIGGDGQPIANNQRRIENRLSGPEWHMANTRPLVEQIPVGDYRRELPGFALCDEGNPDGVPLLAPLASPTLAPS